MRPPPFSSSPASRQHLAQRLCDALLAALAPSSPSVGARDEHEVVAVGELRRAAQKASLSRRFIRLRSTAPPTLRPTEIPSRGSSPESVARERVDDEVAAGVRAALAVDAVEVGAAGQPAPPPAAGRALRRGVHRYGVSRLRPLSPAALENRPAASRLHARTEPVCTGSLALLGLVGALHRLRAQGSASGLWTRCEQPFSAICEKGCRRRSSGVAGARVHSPFLRDPAP